MLIRCGALLLLLTRLLIGGESATFVLQSGEVLFGTFQQMAGGTITAKITGEDGAKQEKTFSKSQLTEIIFDNGTKLDLTLSDYPPIEAPSTPVKAPQRETASVNPPTAKPPAGVQQQPPPEMAYARTSPVDPAQLRNPFTYGFMSAVVPGLGQIAQKQYVKGAVGFALVSGALAGTMVAWSLTTDDYNDWKNEGHDSRFKDFMLKKRGAQVLSLVSAALYLLNIGDAAFDARLFNKTVFNQSVQYSLHTAGGNPGLQLTMGF